MKCNHTCSDVALFVGVLVDKSTQFNALATLSTDVVLFVGVLADKSTQCAARQSKRSHRTLLRLCRNLGLWRMSVSFVLFLFYALIFD